MIDGEWFRRRLQSALAGKMLHGVTADLMYRNALLSLEPDEELFRIFYYDCPPYEGKETNPIDQSTIDFGGLPRTAARKRFLKEFKAMDYVAMRLGVAKQRGWTFSKDYIDSAITKNQHLPPCAKDVFLNVEQKGVDMRIGIDVATLALKQVVDRIILISGDTAMIPALKLARREGVQVVLVAVDNSLAESLDEDADLVRRIVPVA